MKVLHISTADRGGGAAIAVFRLTEAMRKKGIDATMLVCEKKSDSKFVVPIPKSISRFSKYIIPVIPVIYSAIRRRLMGSMNYSFINGISHCYRIAKHSLIKEADVIFIHWVQGSFLNINDVAEIIRTGKSIYIFLHDMWHITGGCHYDLGCNKWMNGCNQCMFIKRRILKNFPSKTLQKKIKLWNHENVNVITPSEWLSEKVRKSPIFSKRKVFTIPNCLNSNTFSVIDRKIARKMLGLPIDRKLILFGAVAGSANPYKGWNYMKQVMEVIDDADLVVFGNAERGEGNYTIHSVGRLSDEQTLALLYNAVDLYVSPTIAESFGQTIVESLSCGTCVVAFSVGGVPEIITDEKFGCLVKVGDCIGLTDNINRMLKLELTNTERMIIHEEVEKKYSYEVVCNKYYSNLIV